MSYRSVLLTLRSITYHPAVFLSGVVVVVTLTIVYASSLTLDGGQVYALVALGPYSLAC